MPDFVPVSGSIEFRITGVSLATGKKMYNVGHVDCASPFPTQAQCQDVVDVVSAWVIASYKAIYCSDVVVSDVRARSNAQEPGPIAINSAIFQAGQLAGDRLPASQALCVNLLSGTTGQRRRGRWFVFQADETTQTDGLYTAAYASAAGLVISVLRDDIATAGYALAIESRRDLALWQVVGFLPQRIPSTLRSRKANRGI